jgi:hypothetical protein
MGASNAGIPAIMQRVVGKVVVVDITPDLRRAPVGERVDLHQMKLCVPVYLKRAGPLRSLVATDTGDPRPQLRKLLSQGFYLSEIAASVRIALPKCRSVQMFLVVRSERRLQSFYSDSVPLLNALHETVGFGK